MNSAFPNSLTNLGFLWISISKSGVSHSSFLSSNPPLPFTASITSLISKLFSKKNHKNSKMIKKIFSKKKKKHLVVYYGLIKGISSFFVYVEFIISVDFFYLSLELEDYRNPFLNPENKPPEFY